MHIGHSKTLLLPDLAAHQRQSIAEGWLGLVIPSCLSDCQLAPSGVLMSQQRDQRKEPQQRWRRAQDSQIRPLPLGLDTQVLADFVIGDLNGLARLRLKLTRVLVVTWSMGKERSPSRRKPDPVV